MRIPVASLLAFATLLAGCAAHAAPSASSVRSVSPSPSGSYGPSEPDGVTYGYLANEDGLQVTYDKADYLKVACDRRTKPEDFVQPDRAYAICFRNINPLLRRVSLSPTARITGVGEDGIETRLTPVQLIHYYQCCSGPNMWQMTLRRGVVVRMLQFRVDGE